jgi:photosystem II stability/assembly factor-like uncharacterized protein
MTQQLINIGSTANDKTGDPLRLAFEKINNNFTQLYSIAGGAGAAAGIDGSVQFRTTNNLNAVAYINNVWVAFGAPNKYFMSYDGTIWTNTQYPSSQQIRAVYASPFNLVAVGDNGTIITSTDNGVTWSAETSGTTENLYAIRYDAATDIFIAVGANGKILISPDSNSWVSQASGVTTDLLAIAYNQIGAGYVVVGRAGTVLISAAGTSWTTESSGVTSDLTGLTHDGVRYIATGASGVIIASTNGIVWFPRTSGTVQNLNAIVTANIANVATRVTVGANGVSFISSDANAAIWTASSTGTAYTLANITYGNGYYYAVGLNGTIIDAANVANGWANISIPGSLDGSANFTFDPITGTLSVPNLDVANLYANVYTANTVVANQIVALEYANLGDVSNIYIGGGNANSVLQTDGNGVLSWVPGLEPGQPNLSIQYNVDGEFTGDANFTYNPTTQTVLSTKSNIGNAVISNLTVSTHAYLGDPANLTITGGANNFSLQTDGLGNLFWGPGPTPSIVALPPVYFVSSPSPGFGQQFSDPVLENYVDNSDITLFVDGQLLEFQNYTLAGDTITINTYLPPNANVDIIRQFVSEANVNYSNANVAAYLPIYGGDILADVVTTTVTTAAAMTTTTLDVFGAATMGNIFANGIFTDNYFYANGVPFGGGGNSNYSNANVANYLPTYTGNLGNVDSITTVGNITAGTGAFFIGDGGLLSNISGTGSYSNANVANYLPTYGGNIAASNITVTGNVVGNVEGLVNGIDIRYLVFDFAYLQPNTYNNPIQYLLAKTGDVAFGTFTVPAPLNIDFGTF